MLAALCVLSDFDRFVIICTCFLVRGYLNRCMFSSVRRSQLLLLVIAKIIFFLLKIIIELSFFKKGISYGCYKGLKGYSLCKSLTG